MADAATLNVRMDVETKESFIHFCEEVGVSASALMNMFAKNVVRNQQVPFVLSTRPDSVLQHRYHNVFPANEAELDAALTAAEEAPIDQCSSAVEGFAAFERRMGW